jgi:hypothetical protein
VDDVERLAVVLLGVRVVQALGQLHHDPDALRRRERSTALEAALHDGLQVGAFDVLHRDVVAIVFGVEVVNLNDIRVLQLRGDGGLVDEHLHEGFIVSEVRQDPLDDDLLLEALRADGLGAEDLGHASHGDLAKEDVLAVSLRKVRRRHAPSVVFGSEAFGNQRVRGASGPQMDAGMLAHAHRQSHLV